MDADAYAGFLKLLLTPASQVPAMTEDVEAYLSYANRREPVVACLPVSRGFDSREAA